MAKLQNFENYRNQILLFPSGLEPMQREFRVRALSLSRAARNTDFMLCSVIMSSW